MNYFKLLDLFLGFLQNYLYLSIFCGLVTFLFLRKSKYKFILTFLVFGLVYFILYEFTIWYNTPWNPPLELIIR